MRKLNRRTFIKQASVLGLGSMVLPGILLKKAGAQTAQNLPDIAIIEGTTLFDNTLLALDRLGGMQRFVKSGQKVGLLINSDFELPGVYTHPDISLAVVKMCFDAGASEVTCLQCVIPEYWERSAHKTAMEPYLARLGNETLNRFPAKFENGGFVKKEVIGAKHLKEIEVVEKLFAVDVLINLPIAKHHATTLFTGALKNMMGVNTRATNVTFHLNGPKRNDPVYLAECIADLNRFRPADLTVMDATLYLTTNGPSGPGETAESNKILAGSDMVALDALGSSYHGYSYEEIPSLAAGEQAGLGTANYQNLRIHEEKA